VVTTWMGEYLGTSIASPYRQYITNCPGQLSLPSFWEKYIEYRPARRGLKRGAFTCVGWQVTLCDTIWQVTLRTLKQVPMNNSMAFMCAGHGKRSAQTSPPSDGAQVKYEPSQRWTWSGTSPSRFLLCQNADDTNYT